MNKKMHWSPNSWQSKPCGQMVVYPSETALQVVLDELHTLPPLVTSMEIERLKQQLAEAALGKSFLLQGGDCAESLDECNAQSITNKLKILLQMSMILVHGLHKPIIRVGRIAGQYAKPRSLATESQNNIELPSYRGDLINRAPFTESARNPDPHLMLKSYYSSGLTLNYIRALIEGGFADLQHPEYWQLDFVKHSALAAEYNHIADSLNQSLSFLKTVAGLQISNLNRIEFYTSHEALHLPYEQALTRQENNAWYNLSTHLPWVGMRTADLNGAHIEYIRGLKNPVAVKIGPGMTSAQLIDLINLLNPEDEPGRLTLIHRFGAAKIKEGLAPLIKAAKTTGKTVLWCCDPMHGNTSTTQDGTKTRRFDDILSELKLAFQLHQENNSYLGGVHFELTGENVTECVGGAQGLTEQDLSREYKTLVDPRLNYEQALEMAMLIAKLA